MAPEPKVILTIPTEILNVLTTKSSEITTVILKGYLEKYNSSQVDSFFKDIGLPEVTTSTPQVIDNFANEVNKHTKQWPTEINKQIRLVTTEFPITAEREKSFWKELEKKVMETKEQLESPGVLLTKLVLKRNNRVSEQLLREVEIELDKCLEIAQVSNTFLRDIPLDLIPTANELPKLTRVMINCIDHFSKLKHSKYDFTRAIRLFEVIASTIFEKVSLLLRQHDLFNCPIEDLCKIKNQTEKLFSTWETQFLIQRGTFRDVAKRRKESIRILQFENISIQKRLLSIVDFREQHEKLFNIISKVSTGYELEVSY